MEKTPDGLPKRPLYVYDLPREILDTLAFKKASVDAIPEHQVNIDDSKPHDQPIEPPSHNESTSKSISCALCGLTFADVQEQRSHVRSDFHNFNMKQKLRGNKPVAETDFEKLVDDLDESLSGSDSSDSDEESDGDDLDKSRNTGDRLSTLLAKTANISEPLNDPFASRKRKRNPGKPPFLWLATPALPANASLGIYRALFDPSVIESGEDVVSSIRSKQLPPKPPPKLLEDGGVALPSTEVGPHVFLCMIGGGHFAAMIVALAPKMGKKGGVEERQASVIAHKTFHRYTTRRKQGGSQSANDNSKGNAHSAGSSLRRYNEEALVKDVRDLLSQWRSMITSSDLLFLRATGQTNRRTLFGPYPDQVLRSEDPRLRGFPFSTRRATQTELMRSFVELTRVKVSTVDETAVAAAAAEAEAQSKAHEAQAAAAKAKAAAASKAAAPKLSEEEEARLLHTTQIESLIRRSKAPALVSYLNMNSLSPNFAFYPPESQPHAHTPTPLHLAASINAPALVSTLLTKAHADPSVKNASNKTPFELAGDRATRDAFRLARTELGEASHDWAAARVPDALSKAEVEQRAAREKADEAAVRQDGLARLQEEEARREEQRRRAGDQKRESKHGKGFVVANSAKKTAEERREEEARGMTPEMRTRLERERRARAAEERLKRLAGN